MHRFLPWLPVALVLAPAVAGGQALLISGVPVAGVSASSSLDTSWPFGLGPRRPPPLASRLALTDPPAPVRYGPERTLDGDPSTAWAPADDGVDAWIRIDLGKERFVQEVGLDTGGSLAGEPPETNARVKAASISAPNAVMTLPTRSVELPQEVGRGRIPLYGQIYDVLNLAIDQVWPGESGRLPIPEITARVLPIDPVAVRAALELEEGTAISAIPSPGRGGEHVVAWSGLVRERLHAELVGIGGTGEAVRVLWRTPVSLQWRGAESVDLQMEPVSFGGPPALLLTYRFEEIGASLAFARVYVPGPRGVTAAWETSLTGDLTTARSQSIAFSGGRAYITTKDEALGYSVVQKVFRYDGGFRQFEPAPNTLAGASIGVTAPSGAVSGVERLWDGTLDRPLVVPGDGVGTMIQLRFPQARRVTAVRMIPGSTEVAADGSSPGYTRPARIALQWPTGHTVDAELEDSVEMQTLYEAWEGEGSVPTSLLTLLVKDVYPAIPGGRMAISELEVYFADPP